MKLYLSEVGILGLIIQVMGAGYSEVGGDQKGSSIEYVSITRVSELE